MVRNDIPNSDNTSTNGAPSPLTRRDLLTRAAAGAGALAAAAVLPSVPAALAASAAGKTIKIGGKDFSEDQIIPHMYSLLLQQAGLTTSETFGLETPALQSALLRGDLDLYPEYTGTGLGQVLGIKTTHDPIIYYDEVSAGYERRFHLTWLNPSPMNDTQGLATTQEVSKKYGIKTISDMVRHASDLRFIANSEFLGRQEDGLPAVKRVYGNFNFKSIKTVAGAGSVRYQLLIHGAGDVVVAFTTDGPIAGYNLVLLADDKGFAPPDNVAPVVRDSTLAANPQIRTILNGLAPLITTPVITQLNYQADVQHMDPRDVAQAFLRKQGLLK